MDGAVLFTFKHVEWNDFESAILLEWVNLCKLFERELEKEVVVEDTLFWYCCYPNK